MNKEYFFLLMITLGNLDNPIQLVSILFKNPTLVI